MLTNWLKRTMIFRARKTYATERVIKGVFVKFNILWLRLTLIKTPQELCIKYGVRSSNDLKMSTLYNVITAFTTWYDLVVAHAFVANVHISAYCRPLIFRQVWRHGNGTTPYCCTLWSNWYRQLLYSAGQCRSICVCWLSNFLIYYFINLQYPCLFITNWLYIMIN